MPRFDKFSEQRWLEHLQCYRRSGRGRCEGIHARYDLVLHNIAAVLCCTRWSSRRACDIFELPKLWGIRIGLASTSRNSYSAEAFVIAGGRWYCFVAFLSHLAIDYATVSSRSAVPTPRRDTTSIPALITFPPLITQTISHIFSFPVWCLWLPFIS